MAQLQKVVKATETKYIVCAFAAAGALGLAVTESKNIPRTPARPVPKLFMGRPDINRCAANHPSLRCSFY